MALTVVDHRTGNPLALAPDTTWRAGPGAREKAAAAAFARAAAFVGLALEPRRAGPVGLYIGEKDPGAGTAWLRVGPETGAGGDAEALSFLRLKTRYSAPLRVDAASLAAAGAERARLLAAASGLEGAPSAASSRGLTGYLHRFREALSRDFDAPEALACVWDGLRPGALSPGSRSALLREALPVLGIP